MAISENEKKVLARAGRILEREMKAMESSVLSSPDKVVEMIQYKIGGSPFEQFGMLVLSNRHTLISCEILFRGCVSSAAVYPYQVIREIIKLNGQAVVYFHNHPSLQGAEPSDTDVRLTRKLVDAGRLIDVRTLDHIVVSGNKHVSFAERGLL